MSRWMKGIQAHFGERAKLAGSDLYALFALPADISEAELVHALEVFWESYDIPVGTPRPDDLIEVFAKQPETHGPIDWYLT